MTARLACALAVAGLTASLAAGCGSSSSASQNTTTTGGTRGARFQAMATCMRSKGFKLPDRSQRRPGSGPPPGLNFRDPRFRDALLACRTKVFGSAEPGPGGRGGGTFQ